MKRVALITVALLATVLWMAPPVGAQQSSLFTVSATINTVKFLVDGRYYTGQATFNWPKGSKHLLEFLVPEDGFQYSDLHSTRYAFGGWKDNQGLLVPAGALVQEVVADPSITSYTADRKSVV